MYVTSRTQEACYDPNQQIHQSSLTAENRPSMKQIVLIGYSNAKFLLSMLDHVDVEHFSNDHNIVSILFGLFG